MHSHLHTEKNKACEDVIRALEECHERGFLHRALGGCNAAKVDVNKCLRSARTDRQTANREKARKDRARIEGVWRDIDTNS